MIADKLEAIFRDMLGDGCDKLLGADKRNVSLDSAVSYLGTICHHASAAGISEFCCGKGTPDDNTA